MKVFVFALALVMVGCANSTDNRAEPSAINNRKSVSTVESLVLAYVKNNNVNAAQSLLHSLEESQFSATLWLAQAEIMLLNGDLSKAEYAFNQFLHLESDVLTSRQATSLIDTMCKNGHFHQLGMLAAQFAKRQDASSLNMALACLAQHEQINTIRDAVDFDVIASTVGDYIPLIAAQVFLSQQREKQSQQWYQRYIANRPELDASWLWFEIAYLSQITPVPYGELKALVSVLVTLYPQSDYARRAKLLVGVLSRKVNATNKNEVQYTQPEAKPSPFTLHVVQKGQTLYSISKQYGTTVSAIEAINPQLNVYDIAIGTAVKIPVLSR